MGLFTYTVAGGAILLIGTWESFVSASDALKQTPSSLQSPPQNLNGPNSKKTSFLSTITFLSISVLSSFLIINSLISLFDAVSSKDNTGFALQLEVIAIGFVFLLCSVLGIFTNTIASFQFSSKLLKLMYVIAFGEEFLLFYTKNKDPSGIENRYYDLTLVPVAICLFSTILELKNPKSNYPRLGRGIGLILQGMWTLQMGFSFYSNLIANGCTLNQRSRGNYTVKCKGHPEYHRGRAIATLQFNCHLAFLVTFGVVIYAFFSKKYSISRESLRYKPLGQIGEMPLDSHSQFSLDTDDEDDDLDTIKEIRSVEMQKAIVAVPELALNGHGSHP